MVFVIVPAFIGLMPGMELNVKTALVPILNVSLATREIIAGSASPMLLVEVYASLIVLAGLGIIGCAKIFGREDAVFRGT
jgi:sodium transport system permease protein